MTNSSQQSPTRFEGCPQESIRYIMNMIKFTITCVFLLASFFYQMVWFPQIKIALTETDTAFVVLGLCRSIFLSTHNILYMNANAANSEITDSPGHGVSHKKSTRKLIQRIDDSDIFNIEEFPSVYFFISGMQIDADGAHKAYHENSSMGLDHLKNAGRKGNWWGIVTVNGRSGGVPTIQGSEDPAPGYYVAGTSLQDSTKDDADPDRYVDSVEVPYIALPSGMKFPVKTGDFGFVINTENNMTSGCIFADVGPRGKIGEGSIALAEAVGISSDPRGDGTESKFIYVLFSDSSMGWPLTVDFINTHSKELFDQFGGIQRLRDVIH